METYKVDADTLNAVISGMGALVFATMRQLTAAQQQAFADDLAVFAKSAERSGSTTFETLLLDLHRAARSAPRP